MLYISVYVKMVMIETMETVKESVSVGGDLLKDVEIGDDQGGVAKAGG